MQVTFIMTLDSQQITLKEMNDFEETLKESILPEDYRQHMIECNGGNINQINIEHKDFPGEEIGISSFLPIKYGNYTVEKALENFSDRLPSGYLPIGHTTGNDGLIIMSLNDDNTFGNIKVRYTEGDIDYLSLSFTDLINDMVEFEDDF